MSGDALFRDRAALVARAFAETGAFASASGLPYGTMTLVNRSWPQVPAPSDVGAGAGADAAEALALPPPPAGWPEQLAASMFVGTGVATAGGLAFNPHWFGGASSTSEVATLQASGGGAREHTSAPRSRHSTRASHVLTRPARPASVPAPAPARHAA